MNSLSNSFCKPSFSIVGNAKTEELKREINSSLSGGELKRIEIATVVARGTSLSIFDEPEAGIDLWSFNNLIEVFENMSKTIQGSIVIISHQERILNIADEIILLNNGKIENIDLRLVDYDIEEALNIMGDCQIVIGTRFHANILGLLLGKTVIPIAYSDKTINEVLMSNNIIESGKLDEILNENDYSYKIVDSTLLEYIINEYFESLIDENQFNSNGKYVLCFLGVNGFFS